MRLKVPAAFFFCFFLLSSNLTGLSLFVSLIPGEHKHWLTNKYNMTKTSHYFLPLQELRFGNKMNSNPLNKRHPQCFHLRDSSKDISSLFFFYYWCGAASVHSFPSLHCPQVNGDGSPSPVIHGAVGTQWLVAPPVAMGGRGLALREAELQTEMRGGGGRRWDNSSLVDECHSDTDW